MTDSAISQTHAAINVNGTELDVSDAGAHTTALNFLRSKGLTSVKEGCAEGECGACAVMVSRPDGNGGTRWTAINSCLLPAAALADQEVYTSEGLAEGEELHPVQYEMAMRGGSQCGYCTPGFISSMAAEYYRPERKTCAEICGSNLCGGAADEPACGSDPELGANGFDLHALSGNLCRCTGYRPIRDAAYALPESPTEGDPLAERLSRPAPISRPLSLDHPEGAFVRPADLSEALALLQNEPEAVLLAGGTDWGVDVAVRFHRAPLTIALDQLQELKTFTHSPGTLEIGAGLTLTEIEHQLGDEVPILADLLPLFASKLIRNGATLGGNLGTGSPIGDGAPVLLALDASLVLAGAQGEREVPLSEYFTGYRQSVREPGELIKSIRIPTPVAPHARFYKIAKRRFDDISSVAVAIAAHIDGGTLNQVRIGLGGMAATPIRALSTETSLEGRPFTQETFDNAARILATEGTPIGDHRASSEYRAQSASQAVLRFFAEVNK
ncbi:MAG TPA: FAD binding domain-containing protein [Beutenbergiaceae bacterium]|nr:FAD binding domain-containing protein [Beutenbergiaceae bacterium]